MKYWHDLLAAQAKARPEAAGFSDSVGVSWSYGALATAVAELSQVITQAGVRPGDRVVVLAENCCAVVAALLASSQCGAVAVPVNARMSSGEVDRILDHARPVVVLISTLPGQFINKS